MGTPRPTKTLLEAAGVGAFFRPRDVLPLGTTGRELRRLVPEHRFGVHHQTAPVDEYVRAAEACGEHTLSRTQLETRAP